MAIVNQGDTAPPVDLKLHSGEFIALADLWHERPVVLFFYPKDGTAVCTKEACAFRDAYDDFVAAGATVVGISGDSAESHRAFADQHRLPFLLATDSDGSVARAFGASKLLGLIPGRVTFVIDRIGVIRHRFSGLFASDQHVREALDAVRALG